MGGNSNLVDSASSHTLVSKIKPCMSKYKRFCTVKLRMAHYISYSLFDSPLLSQNPCWKATIFTSPDVTRITIGFGRASYSIAISNVGRDKSFVDDLNMERGIVSMRVGFVLRSAEIQPLVPAIC